MVPKPIPDGWLDYIPVGDQVRGTRFIPFKVPLNEHVVASVPDSMRLSCDSLLTKIPNLGLIIDLTNTNRYYNPKFFTEKGISYQKLMIPGREVPGMDKIIAFRNIVHKYMKENSLKNKLIGVHCTHGLNRTGFLICNYMVSYLKIDPDKAIKHFENARGHRIERENYRNFLKGLSKSSRTGSDINSGWRNSSNTHSNMNSGQSNSSNARSGMNGRWSNSSNISSDSNSGRRNNSSTSSDVNYGWRNNSSISSYMNSGRGTAASAFGRETAASAFGRERAASAFGRETAASAFGRETAASAFGRETAASAFGRDTAASAFGRETAAESIQVDQI